MFSANSSPILTQNLLLLNVEIILMQSSNDVFPGLITFRSSTELSACFSLIFEIISQRSSVSSILLSSIIFKISSAGRTSKKSFSFANSLIESMIVFSRNSILSLLPLVLMSLARSEIVAFIKLFVFEVIFNS